MVATADIDGSYTEIDNGQTGLVPFEERSGSISLWSAQELRQAMREETERRVVIQEFISHNLKSGVDYGIVPVPGRESKPTLFKPGAEKLCSLLHLRADFYADTETLSMAGNTVGLFALICRLVDVRTGSVLAEGRGSADLAEKRGWTVNSAIKICEKRAQVDAVLRLGFSDVWTQDLEDLTVQQGQPQPISAPVLRAVSNGPVQAAPQQQNTDRGPYDANKDMRPVTQGQVGRAFAIAKSRKPAIGDEQLKAIVLSRFGKKIDELTRADIQELFTDLENPDWNPATPVQAPVAPQPLVRIARDVYVEQTADTSQPRQQAPDARATLAQAIGKHLHDIGVTDRDINDGMAFFTGVPAAQKSNRTLAQYQQAWAKFGNMHTSEEFLEWLEKGLKNLPLSFDPAEDGV